MIKRKDNDTYVFIHDEFKEELDGRMNKNQSGKTTGVFNDPALNNLMTEDYLKLKKKMSHHTSIDNIKAYASN